MHTDRLNKTLLVLLWNGYDADGRRRQHVTVQCKHYHPTQIVPTNNVKIRRTFGADMRMAM